MMEHTTKDGQSKLVRSCRYPLTALGCVRRIYTDLAVIDVGQHGFEVAEMVPGLSFDMLQGMTDVALRPGPSLRSAG